MIHELELEKCAKTSVVNCSGGEQKRLSIGCELVSKPDVLLLDEPTSGLDIAGACATVDLLAVS